ncbi:leucyl/phenylalanyl-tRNA--protein transferase [Balneicella halophila]|uniref:Leucyl/phenylalanyl-tRNA--protein transferase n=1 Tax=Balneicella halophila TaxID=1537566 RepID=A0A7L4UN31_BALHA|nr:leucyl/phenylalanyl-tRNA--protein transferase [Balneicella halophila]PVX49885.1 leucyl/phenylalanyl-tRNA--protein transferase [Balneicella halophila]
MYQLTNELVFPHPMLADEHGILAYGGDLSAERLMLAYTYGVFPWYNEGDPIMWWSPEQRFVLFPEDLRVSKSMKKVLRNKEFVITQNEDFSGVVRSCKEVQRPGQDGTWITDEMEKAYTKLHAKGIAQSIEVWKEDKLVGGLYGVVVRDVFCGESMFAKVSNASKAGFITLVQSKQFKLFDCQVHTDHLERLGAKHIPREDFLRFLGIVV